ncbi:hypothetical protein IV86_GL000182 [Pediococcus pentosaceus]|nr:hypothetical protein IV86_GL000182 [Pediococcus pentosaceus]CCG89600.1 putative membrane protein [Pediococcus pentosaceus IE-3]
MKRRDKIQRIILFALITSGLSWWVVSFLPDVFTFNWWVVGAVNALYVFYVLGR